MKESIVMSLPVPKDFFDRIQQLIMSVIVPLTKSIAANQLTEHLTPVPVTHWPVPPLAFNPLPNMVADF